MSVSCKRQVLGWVDKNGVVFFVWNFNDQKELIKDSQVIMGFFQYPDIKQTNWNPKVHKISKFHND